ncbi:hypothetical protein NQZ68_000147 [Dissostichus eleginoides]|nr:hypothetical protein NQZ68_000147 [Dissostichus eleginoides]
MSHMAHVSNIKIVNNKTPVSADTRAPRRVQRKRPEQTEGQCEEGSVANMRTSLLKHKSGDENEVSWSRGKEREG